MKEKIEMIAEQFDDIINGFGNHGDFSLVYSEKPNEFGGNPHIQVVFNATINTISYKEKIFVWQMASQTEQGFINEIKAHLFDVLDSVVNL